MKLLDAVFAMAVAPYTRAFPELPFAEAWQSDPAMAGIRAIQKLVHVALQVQESHGCKGYTALYRSTDNLLRYRCPHQKC